MEKFEQPGPLQRPDDEPNPLTPQVVADAAASFTYASYQNAVPVVRSITINNVTARQFDDCCLSLTSSPAFLRPKIWTIDRLASGDSLALTDRKVELDADYLAGLNEAERGEIRLSLSSHGDVLHECVFPVRLLARDEWGGVSDMAQLLPAFVMPNDPGIAQTLRAAAEQLVAYGHPSGLDGYQSGSPQRAYMLSAAVYSAVVGLGLFYAEPPASFERSGQKVRRPATVIDQRLATCLDTTLYFAAALEAAGLNPVILMFEGHSAAGVWLTPRTFGNAIEPDQMEVRKALASRELIVFETTGVTHRPAMTLEAAQSALDHRMGEHEAHGFVAAIDVRRARSGGIMPLASHEPAWRDDNPPDDGGQTPMPLPAMPSFTSLAAEEVEVKPTTAAGRIDRWQRKLLDLTLRNRLLNFPESKKTIPFVCTDPAFLEDRLAGGTAIRIISLPAQNPLGERDPALYRDVHGKDIQREFAAEALKRDELPSPLDTAQLDARLIDLHRQVRNDFAEGGANTLFLAVGFLRWKKKPEDVRTYRAPLLLVPVKLERSSASSPFRIRYHEDEPRFNATLLQFLEREFDLKLPQFSGELPLDDNGVDVPKLLALMRLAVRDAPGMEVVDETALSTFSFAKFLMWKDLVERTDALRENRMVRHLIDTPEQAFGANDSSGVFHEEADIDRAFAPADIVCLLPSDSSQTAASLAAAAGRDFVIVGPPGTGKSQTIANMIANCLAVGKTVLFVAEKTAALDVVYRRLREHGLGDHCIELHSNKADRRNFLGQLKAAWENGTSVDPAEWVAINERLRLRRDTLNNYVAALHTVYPNGWTPYTALGIALKDSAACAPELSWPQRDAHDAATLLELEDLAGELGRVFASIERVPALDMVDIAAWSAGWQENMLTSAQSLRNATDLLGGAYNAYQAALGIRSAEPATWNEIEQMAALAKAVEAGRELDLTIAFDPAFAQCKAALDGLGNAIARYRNAERAMDAAYAPRAVRDLDPDALDRQWREADASFWPMSILGKRKVRKLLQGYADGGEAQPEEDLQHLREMKESLAAIDGCALNGCPLPVDGLDTDMPRVADVLERAARVRGALRLTGYTDDLRQTVERSVEACLRDSGDENRLLMAGSRLLAGINGFDSAREQFSAVAGRPVSLGGSPGGLARVSEELKSLVDGRHLLRDWAAWCQVRNRADACGLSPLVEQLEGGLVDADASRSAFRTGYARWWLPQVLDGDPVLRDFRRFQHENVITEFREIDDLVRSHAATRVIGAISHGLPPVQGVPRNSELGLLRHQMELQRPSQSIRELIGKMPETFSKLAPCMLMSPLSIAQYFPPNQSLFDVVIFDEASQITTWDAVGAIARGRQTIIVGDPKQLPPTNFFGRNEDEEDVADHEKDLESILDEAKAAGVPVRDLRWHYRSRSESLIAFSNHHYYKNRLVTFPSPKVDDQAVRLQKVLNGIYDRGKSRTNRIEAQAVADEAVARMRSWLKMPEKERPTLGIITFNAQQQSLIMDLLDAARRELPELEYFFAEDRIEGTIVKNLENVQGDERDVILFSITFWKDAAGKLTMDFGALNRDGGERRLNVAVTRARQELIVFSGFTADQVDTSRTKALAVQHLKTFLDYAERGAIALPAQDIGSVGTFESPFEEAVAERLEQSGWMLVPQVGISGFRIDLGVRHPDLPGAYLAGVECDGATYHSAATARDRDKVREQVLTGLGWNILRVWSTDWWFDAAGCAARLDGQLSDLLAASRERQAAEAQVAEALPTGHWDMGQQIKDAYTIEDHDAVVAEAAQTYVPEPEAMLIRGNVASVAQPLAPPDPVDEPHPAKEASKHYRITDLSGFSAHADRFATFAYRETLRAMVDAVMEAESPLRTDILYQRIARAHGWQRTGARIRDQIALHLRDCDRTEESVGEFTWKKGAVVQVHPYRSPADDDARRAIAEIPLAELVSVVLENEGLAEMPDAPRDMARLLGVDRLAATSRERLEEALARARAIASSTSTGIE